jgi:hypothetical protein
MSAMFSPRRELAPDELLGRASNASTIGDAPAALGELREVVLLPPVLEVAVGVELRALIVEPVGELVADHHADPAEVRGDRAILPEERRLQDARRHGGVVDRGLVVGVDLVRVQLPLASIDRLARPGELAVGLERGGAQHVAGEVVALDDVVVGLPPVGEPDHAGDPAELGERGCLVIRHPVDTARLVITSGQRVDQLARALLSSGK